MNSISARLPGALQRWLGLGLRAPHDWESGVTQETTFWDEYLGAATGPYVAERTERLDPTQPLQWWLVGLLPPGQARYRFLDVGAGPLTWLGKVHRDFELEIIAVDPLAAVYDTLLARHGITPPVRTRYGAAEQLTSHFAPESFDLVNARNSIDHSRDALLAIDQMLAVLKPGCALVLHHNIREAERQGFEGMHGWNFFARRGAFWVSRPGADGRLEATNVNERLAAVATIRTELFGSDWMRNIIIKR